MGVRLRPATGLCVILAIAFALELIAVLSVPVTSSITLCTYQNFQFGVFGYCDTTTNKCSDVGIGYGDVTAIDGFSLPSNARHTLANLLIVHVVAAGLTLILLLLTLAAHFQKFAHSSHYLLFILILSLPCFMLSLLAFLVDILLFVPHLDWGGWIVLAATVLIVLFGVLLCIMRRTMSSRKAMKCHDENSELQTLNHFNSSSAFMPDGGMVYGGETVHKSPNIAFAELKYSGGRGATTDNDDNLPLNMQSQGNNIYSNQSNNASGDLDVPFYPAGSDMNNYENFRNQTPSPFQEYRSPDYTDYADYRANGSAGWAGANSAGAPRYDYARQAPSAVAAAAATAGTIDGTTVAVSQGPGRRARQFQPSVTESIIPAGMSYGTEYDDGASVAPDSYKEFGGNVVPLPRIHNPVQAQSYSNQNETQTSFVPSQRSVNNDYMSRNVSSSSQRNITPAQQAQAGFSTESSSVSPAQYETAAESSSENLVERGLAGPSTNQWRGPASERQITPDRNAPPSAPWSSQRSRTRTPEQFQLLETPGSSNTQQQYMQPQEGEQVYSRTPEHQEARRPSASRHQDLRALYVPEDNVGDDQYALPVLDSSHLQTVNAKRSNTSLDVPSSPAISDSSHFTSVSQRPVNPKYFQQPATSRKAASDRTDFVLANNPDFQLPGMPATKRGKGSALTQQAMGGPQPSQLSLGAPRARPGKSAGGVSNNLDNVLGASLSKEGPYGASRGL